MNNIKTYFLIFAGLLILVFAYNFSGLKSSTISPEISIFNSSPLGKSFGKVIAASCGLSTAGHKDEDYTPCTATPVCPGTAPFPDITLSLPGRSLCGGVCTPILPNPCPYFCQQGIVPITPTNTGYLYYDIIYQGVYAYKNDGTGKPTPIFTLSPCPQPMRPQVRRLCDVSRTTSDGSQTSSWTEDYDAGHKDWTNPAQPFKTYPYTENIKVRCGYYSDTLKLYLYQSPWVQANAVIENPNYGKPCTATNACGVTSTGTYDIYGICSAANTDAATCSLTNVCGQKFNGYQCPSGCTAGGGASNINNSCIANFKVTTTTVNPNGSVEFSWSIPQVQDVTSKCGFFDLTTPTPRPVPGLQDLDPTINSARISNIQTTTRFCLICQFYNIANGGNTALGSAAVHQWIRVIRIGEN